MTQTYDETGRANPAAAGALIGGAVLLIAGMLWKILKKERRLGEDSPIIIKSGSLSLALLDFPDPNADDWSVSKYSNHAYRITGSPLNYRRCQVAVARLESGFPVADLVIYPNVTEVALDLVRDNGDHLDLVTVSVAPGVLTVTAQADDDFGDEVKVRTVKKSYKHKKRAFHKKVRNKDDFEIGRITVVSNGTAHELDPNPEYTLALDFFN